MRGHTQRRKGTLRTKVLGFVQRNPGASVAQVARAVRAGWTSVHHHVDVLVSSHQIRRITYEGRAVLVASDLAPAVAVLTVPLANPDARRILEAIARFGTIRVHALAKRLGWSRKVVQRRVNALVAAGLVRRSKDYHPRFSLTGPGGRAVRMLR